MTKVQIKKIGKNKFPKRLLQIPDPPEYLYIRGEIPPEDYKWLAVVGSRKYTSYGKEACEKLISGLRGYPIIIVSGLALGIDAISHKSALSAGLKTIACPGSGLDPKFLYPSTNKKLAEEIISAGGALLSEFEPDFQATPYSFPQRNRIMAGLSDAVMVVEAELKSGTLITSKFATDYNRDVFTIPGSIFSSTSDGPHMLMRLGATPITSSEDILEAFGFKTDDEETNQKVLELRYLDCSPDEKKVLEILKSPCSRDEITAKLKMPISQVNALLSIMEIKGLIKESGGEMYII